MVTIFTSLFIICMTSPTSGFAKVAKSMTPASNFAIDTDPSEADWRRFHTLSTMELKTLWTSHSTKGITLQKWSWQWRLGWLKACAEPSRIEWCDKIISAGLQDPSAVVRSEAADTLVEAKKGHYSVSDKAKLVASFNRPDNFRNNQPLFTSKRILSALIRMNSHGSVAEATKLAKRNKELNSYTRSLQSSAKKADQFSTH